MLNPNAMRKSRDKTERLTRGKTKTKTKTMKCFESVKIERTEPCAESIETRGTMAFALLILIFYTNVGPINQ